MLLTDEFSQSSEAICNTMANYKILLVSLTCFMFSHCCRGLKHPERFSDVCYPNIFVPINNGASQGEFSTNDWSQTFSPWENWSGKSKYAMVLMKNSPYISQ